jgi:hypothetical protein
MIHVNKSKLSFIKLIIVPLFLIVVFSKGIISSFTMLFYLDFHKKIITKGVVVSAYREENIDGLFYEYEVEYIYSSNKYLASQRISPQIGDKRQEIGDTVILLHSKIKPSIAVVKPSNQITWYRTAVIIFLLLSAYNIYYLRNEFIR